MPDEKEKSRRLLVYWLFSTVLMVFGAVTATFALIVRPMGGTTLDAITSGMPIWGITAVAAIIIYAGYHFYTNRE